MRALPGAMSLAFALASPAPRSAQSPPAGLSCLAHHYPLQIAREGQTWYAKLSDGASVPFDDGKVKSFEERVAGADLEDTFVPRYETGPTKIENRAQHDPGRFRSESFLKSLYGLPPARGDRVRIPFFGTGLTVHRALGAPLARVERRLASAVAQRPQLARWLRRFGGAYNPRNVAGTERPSAHAYGIALDLDPSQGHYWRWDHPRRTSWSHQLPQEIVDAFEAEGFIWGGRWYHYDTFHFEYRPELLDARCWAPDGG